MTSVPNATFNKYLWRKSIVRGQGVMHFLGSRPFLFLLLMVIVLTSVPGTSLAYHTEIRAFSARVVPTIDGKLSMGEWNDTFLYEEPVTHSTVAFKHDEQNLYILAMIRTTSPSTADYFGIEFDNNGDAAHMGRATDPDDAIFASSRFSPDNVTDAFLTGFAFPSFDIDVGGTDDASGTMAFANGTYTVEIRRPLSTGDSKGYDAQLSLNSTLGIGFVFGRFGEGAAHLATDMSTYAIFVSAETTTEGGEIAAWNPIALANSSGTTLLVFTGALCAYHLFRRMAWRQQMRETKDSPRKSPMTAVERHSLSMRVTHWIHASLMFFLLTTGWTIHTKSYIFGSSTSLFHVIAGILIVGVDFPVHFYSMWKSGDMKYLFLPSIDDFRVAFGVTTNFFGLSKGYPEHATFMPEKGTYYLDRKYCSYQKFLLWGDIFFILVMMFTGFALYWPENFQWVYEILGGGLNTRALHLFSFYYFGASITAHVYLSFIPAHWGRLRSLVLGRGNIRVHLERPPTIPAVPPKVPVRPPELG